MITLNELKTNYLGIATSETSNDTLLQLFIDTSTKHIENYCGQVLLQRSVVSDYALNGRYMNDINVYGVPMTITNVIGGNSFRPSEWTTITSDEYELISSNNQYVFALKDSATFRRYVRITANVGWAVANVPNPLKEACGRLCIELRESSKIASERSRLGVTNVSEQTAVGTSSTTFIAVMNQIAPFLESYRICNI